MKKILFSLAVLAVAAGAAVLGTRAFFSDTETSNDNLFAAGAIDLKIDSTAHYAGMVCTDGLWVEEPQGSSTRPDLLEDPCTGTWPEKDLVNEKFFSYSDLKPGDTGENTISIHVDNNDAWLCADITGMVDADNTITEPEDEARGDTPNDLEDLTPLTGDLAPELHFLAWSDNGTGDGPACNNVYDGGDEQILFSNVSGPASDVLDGKTYALHDSTTGNGVFPGGETRCIGLQWCYGTLAVDESNTITCDGVSVDNLSQTDSLTADLAFRVVQARNNENFSCALTAPTVTPLP